LPHVLWDVYLGAFPGLVVLLIVFPEWAALSPAHPAVLAVLYAREIGAQITIYVAKVVVQIIAALAAVVHAVVHAALVVAQIQRCLRLVVTKVAKAQIHLVLYPVVVTQVVAAQVEKDQTHFVQLVLNLQHCV